MAHKVAGKQAGAYGVRVLAVNLDGIGCQATAVDWRITATATLPPPISVRLLPTTVPSCSDFVSVIDATRRISCASADWRSCAEVSFSARIRRW